MILSLLYILIPSNTFTIAHEPISAYVTAYVATGNLNSAGQVPKRGTIACPRKYPLYTKFKIWDWIWECQDRTNLKYDGRFDIFSNSYEDAIYFGIQKTNIEIIQ